MEYYKKENGVTLQYDIRGRLTKVINKLGTTLVSSIVYVGDTMEVVQLQLLERINVFRDGDVLYSMIERGVKHAGLRNVFLNQDSGAFMWMDENGIRRFVGPIGCAHIRAFREVECSSCKQDQVT